MRKSIVITLLCFFALVLVGLLTCPDEQAHKKAIQQELDDMVEASMNESMNIGDTDFEQGLAMMGKSIVSSLAGSILDNSIRVNNYFVFSTGEISYGGKKKTLTFGVLGHVFVGFDADDMKDGKN